MARLLLWLLNGTATLTLTVFGATAPNTLCHNEQWRTEVTQHLFRHYYYPGPEWQHYCDSVLQICPDYDYLWQMKAMPAVKMGIYELAFASLSHAVVLNREKQLPYQAFLKCTFAKDYEGALLDFEESERMISGGGLMDHSFSFYKGLCYLGLNDPQKAVDELEKDILQQTKRSGKGNEHYNSLFYLGLAYLLSKEYEQAEAYLKASIKAYSRFPDANFYLGRLYRIQRRKTLAATHLQIAKDALQSGASMNEDNNFYVDYPYQAGLSDIEKEIFALCFFD